MPWTRRSSARSSAWPRRARARSASGLANQIGLSWGLTGQPAGFLADLAALDKLGAAQVKRAAEKYLARNRLAMVLARPVAARPAGGKP